MEIGFRLLQEGAKTQVIHGDFMSNNQLGLQLMSTRRIMCHLSSAVIW